MDEVENVEDLNELESRLYAQIHHEEANEKQVNELVVADRYEDGSCGTTSRSNRTLSKRYWASGRIDVGKFTQQKHLINPSIPQPKQSTKVQSSIPTPTLVDDGDKQNGKQIHCTDSSKSSYKLDKPPIDRSSSNKSQATDRLPNELHINKFRKSDPAKSHQVSSATPASQSIGQKSGLKVNPVTDWMKRHSNPFVNKSNKKETYISNANPKQQGPFFKQQHKLEKAKRVENKKQKSKKVATKAKKQTSPDVINLLSGEESDGSDVVVIPVPPPPTFIVHDSDDDEKVMSEISESAILEQEENALDSSDVQMSSSSSFIKPQQQTSHPQSTPDCAEKRLDNSSRCTSPSSIQSSDDFIGNVDRSRLLESASGMADDEDLLLLTSDMNSLLEAPQRVEHAYTNSSTKDQQNSIDNCPDNANANDSSEFVTPKTAAASSKANYRVEQTQFRALDVYESESDITDSIYSKGTSKATVIRKIDISSDEVEDITCVNVRNKRLRKRRASSSNKSSDANYENTQSSSDNNDDDHENECNDSGTERTGIPFISRGPAVERKIRKRSRTLSTCLIAPVIGKSSISEASTGNMSDGDFIAKLNNLVQGHDGENEADESDDAENGPSAREIAEKILGENASPVPKDTAVPKDVCNRLNKVLNTIDIMEESEKEVLAKEDDIATTECIDLRSNDQQKAIVYKSVPSEDTAQIITYVADKSPSTSTNREPVKKRAANGSPIYNVVYVRGGKMLSGGIGWNNEMRTFYEQSWNGEDFVLSDVWQKMNPEKNLWRICSEDRHSKSIKRHSNLKCTNCCDFGHSRSHCRRPRKPLICYMCGESGHQEPRCPNTICLRCGNKTQVFIKGCNACSFQNRLVCPICKIRGHSIDFCPDKWRRYYSTTETNAFPNCNIVYNSRKYCSICGHRGHLSDMCRSAVHFMEYPVIAAAVKSHQKSYNDMAIKSTFGGIGCNLMYEPCQEYIFDMSKRTTTDKYYGRFLRAVGMDFVLTRKRHQSPETDGSAKKRKRSSNKSEPKKDEGGKEVAPNQVQEISESGSVNNESFKDTNNTNTTTTSAEEVESTVLDDNDIQLNIMNPTTSVYSNFSNFKSPNKVTSANNPPQIMDSDSNYSFSEHFDVPSTSTNVPNVIDSNEMQNEGTDESATTLPSLAFKERTKPREMEVLPDFIPLVQSTVECDDETDGVTQSVQNDCLRGGISRRFISAESDDDYYEEDERKICQSSGLPCEAKIYLTNFHSKYLLSVDGRNFLAKSSKDCDLKARLDFTSVGHVLVIFGVPNNQDKFQRELLMKYREITHQENQKHLQSTPNVPKRTDVLIRFLRDDINQLFCNLGNVNHLFKRLQYVERQQSKSGFKLADKIRRSLNMILVGQAGLQDGNIHLDKLLFSLKTLINGNISEEVTPSQLRTEICDHWKFIFSSYRHDNYQELVQTYNKLVMKNRLPKLIIDPMLLGNKLLDTSFTAEQKEKLEQSKQQLEAPNKGDLTKRQAVCNPFTPKNSKHNKRKQSLECGNSLPPSPAKTPSAQCIRPDACNMSTPVKTKSTATNSTTPISVSKKQQHKSMPPLPFVNPEKRSTVCTDIQHVSSKWKNTCDTLLTEISAKPSPRKGNNARDSKLPSTFWSRESMRYLDECMPIVSSRPELMEKVKRVQSKSKSGQLSYNDYLAVIKLHTALTGK